MTGQPLLRVAGLQAGYGESRVLFDVSFDIHEGDVVTLLGRNGMGKTTTILALMGILASTAGEVTFSGTKLQGLPSFKIARLGIGLVPEGRQIFPNLTVRENLAATAMANQAAAPWNLERTLDLFPSLRARLDSPGNLLSGGEQQMLAIGRAMMTNPRLLILDEATEGLAPLIRQQIWMVLEQIKSAGVSILIVDKNIEPLMKLATRHSILEKGRTVWQGSSKDLRCETAVKTRYLGL